MAAPASRHSMVWPELVCARDTGEQLFSIELFRYGRDNELYARDSINNRIQKWNTRTSRWEAVEHEYEVDDQFTLTSTVSALFPVNLLAFLAIGFISSLQSSDRGCAALL